MMANSDSPPQHHRELAAFRHHRGRAEELRFAQEQAVAVREGAVQAHRHGVAGDAQAGEVDHLRVRRREPGRVGEGDAVDDQRIRRVDAALVRVVDIQLDLVQRDAAGEVERDRRLIRVLPADIWPRTVRGRHVVPGQCRDHAVGELAGAAAQGRLAGEAIGGLVAGADVVGVPVVVGAAVGLAVTVGRVVARHRDLRGVRGSGAQRQRGDPDERPDDLLGHVISRGWRSDGARSTVVAR